MRPKHLSFLIVGVVPVFVAGCGSSKPQQARGMPVVPVSVAVASREAVPVEVHAVGTVEPFRTVQVKSQIAGELMSVHFTEGGDVKQGDLLFEIDPRPYREALRQAEAALARDQAQLLQAQATVSKDEAQARSADADAKRYQELAKEGMAPRNQYEQLRAAADALRETIRADRAGVESVRALVNSDKAAIDRARLELGYCQIRSPLSGRAGNLLVQPGNLVKANGDTAMVVINQITPIFVSFGVPEEFLNTIRARNASGKLPVTVTLQDGSGKSTRGTLTVIDNTVDTNTGTIRLKAIFDNAERLLWPGQFVNAALTLDTQHDAVVVPSEAVQDGQRGTYVYVVKADKTVESRSVTVARTAGRKAIIQKGVAAGETVVTDGQLRLFPGARIEAVPASNIDTQAL